MEHQYPDTTLTIQRFERETGREQPYSIELWNEPLASSADIGSVTDSALFIWVWGSGG